VADNITTTTTLKAGCYELDSVIDSLLDAAEFDNDPLKPHKAAWTQTIKDLLRNRPEMTESDLTDSTELQEVVHLLVLHILFRLSDIEADKITAQKYWNKYRKAMNEVQLNDGISQASETLLVRG
jgi:hypothetical protein